MICINIKYGCGHLGVVTFAIEILRMSEIALDPHLHYLLLCHSYVGLRYDLLARVAAILQLRGLSSPSSNQELVKVILYGD